MNKTLRFAATLAMLIAGRVSVVTICDGSLS